MPTLTAGTTLHWFAPVFENTIATNLTAAALRIGLVWKEQATRTLSTARISIRQTAGTTTGILKGELFLCDANGVPTGAALSTVTGVNGTGSPTITFSPGVSVTAGSYYALVVSNTDAAPATNTFGVAQVSEMAGGSELGFTLYSRDSGTTWDSVIPGFPVLVLGYSSGARWGSVALGGGTLFAGSLTSVVDLYSTSGSRLGMLALRTRPTTRRWIYEVVASLGLVGSQASAGAIVCRIYVGSTLVATSSNSFTTSSTAGTIARFTFPSGVLVESGQDVSIALCQQNATGGNASNCFRGSSATNAGIVPTGFTDVVPEGSHLAVSTATTPSWTPVTNAVPVRYGYVPAPARGGF